MQLSANRDNVFIVIPAYNESRNIRDVVARVLAIYPHVVVVDDGSTDDLAARLTGLRLFVLRHPINRGQGAALQTGIRFALLKNAEIIVTFDADGQHDAADLEALVEPIQAGECDVALGSRFLGRAHHIPFIRKAVLKLGILFTRVVSRIEVSDTHNGLRAFSRRAACSLHISMDRMAHASEILDQIKQAHWRFKEVPVNIYYSAHSRAKGQSSWNALAIAFQVLFKRITG
jgi:glycosyltransferase involved in cell wall biosynthesis